MAIERFLDGFDFAVYQDFLTQAGPAIGSFTVLLFWILIAYIFVNTLIAGGILTIIGRDAGKFSLGTFFGGCGQYVGRFFRLFAIFAVFIAVTMAIAGAILAGVFMLATGNADSEVPLVIWGVILASIAVTVLGLLIVTLDFAKIATVRFDLSSMLKSTGVSIAFVFRHFISVMMSVVLVLMTLAAGTIVYAWVASAVGMDSDLALAIVFIIQQAYVLFRISLRVSFYACEIQLHEHFAAVPDHAGDSVQAAVPGA